MGDSKNNWHSYNVVATFIAALSMIFAGLKWYSESQGREDIKQIQMRLDDANRRYERLLNDQRDDLARRNLSFNGTLNEWELKCASQAASLEEDKRTIQYLESELDLSQSTNRSEKFREFSQNTTPVSELKSTNNVDPIIGGWSGSVLGTTICFNFLKDGTAEEIVNGSSYKGTYVVHNQDRIEMSLKMPILGYVKSTFLFYMDGETLHMKPDQLISVWVTYNRSQN